MNRILCVALAVLGFVPAAFAGGGYQATQSFGNAPACYSGATQFSAPAPCQAVQSFQSYQVAAPVQEEVVEVVEAPVQYQAVQAVRTVQVPAYQPVQVVTGMAYRNKVAFSNGGGHYQAYAARPVRAVAAPLVVQQQAYGYNNAAVAFGSGGGYGGGTFQSTSGGSRPQTVIVQQKRGLFGGLFGGKQPAQPAGSVQIQGTDLPPGTKIKFKTPRR